MIDIYANAASAWGDFDRAITRSTVPTSSAMDIVTISSPLAWIGPYGPNNHHVLKTRKWKTSILHLVRLSQPHLNKSTLIMVYRSPAPSARLVTSLEPPAVAGHNKPHGFAGQACPTRCERRQGKRQHPLSGAEIDDAEVAEISWRAPPGDTKAIPIPLPSDRGRDGWSWPIGEEAPVAQLAEHEARYDVDRGLDLRLGESRQMQMVWERPRAK